MNPQPDNPTEVTSGSYGSVCFRLVRLPDGSGRAGASSLARSLVEREARSFLVGGIDRAISGGGAGVGSADSRRDAERDEASWLTWVRTAPGRPHLVEAPGFHFSVSYAGPYLGLAFGTAPIGLDLETAGRTVNLALARRFAAGERRYLATAPAALASPRLLELWTQKEAYLKWLGLGLAGGLDSFSVLDPAALGVAFTRLPPGPNGDLIGHICTAVQ